MSSFLSLHEEEETDQEESVAGNCGAIDLVSKGVFVCSSQQKIWAMTRMEPTCLFDQEQKIRSR